MGVMPYKIAVLVYVYNDAGKLLLLHRAKAPNQGLYSPIGGKLEQGIGESPYACALREIEEEIGIKLALADIRLLGLVSERGYEGQTHWLMFCFEALRRLNFAERTMNEGRLEWVEPAMVATLKIPKTDQEVIWPLVREHSSMMGGGRKEGGFFSVHIDCTDEDKFVVTREELHG